MYGRFMKGVSQASDNATFWVLFGFDIFLLCVAACCLASYDNHKKYVFPHKIHDIHHVDFLPEHTSKQCKTSKLRRHLSNSNASENDETYLTHAVSVSQSFVSASPFPPSSLKPLPACHLCSVMSKT